MTFVWKRVQSSPPVKNLKTLENRIKRRLFCKLDTLLQLPLC